jgi:hypothetical protein
LGSDEERDMERGKKKDIENVFGDSSPSFNYTTN